MEGKKRMGRPRKHKDGELEVITLALPKGQLQWLRTLYKGHISEVLVKLVDKERRRQTRPKRVPKPKVEA